MVADEAPGLFSQSKTLRDYRLGQPVATCGPGDIWAIYSGTCKKPGEMTEAEDRRVLNINLDVMSKPSECLTCTEFTTTRSRDEHRGRKSS